MVWESHRSDIKSLRYCAKAEFIRCLDIYRTPMGIRRTRLNLPVGNKGENQSNQGQASAKDHDQAENAVLVERAGDSRGNPVRQASVRLGKPMDRSRVKCLHFFPTLASAIIRTKRLHSRPLCFSSYSEKSAAVTSWRDQSDRERVDGMVFSRFHSRGRKGILDLFV